MDQSFWQSLMVVALVNPKFHWCSFLLLQNCISDMQLARLKLSRGINMAVTTSHMWCAFLVNKNKADYPNSHIYDLVSDQASAKAEYSDLKGAFSPIDNGSFLLSATWTVHSLCSVG